MRQKDVTEAELSVLQVLWDLGPSTIRRITDELYPRGGASEYATVQKLLERLESKRFVSRRRVASPHVFASLVDRQELVGRRIQEISEKLCEGSLTPVITHLVANPRLTSEDRAALRRLIDDGEKKRSARDRRRKG